MTKRSRFLTIAVLLTLLDLAVAVCFDWPVWTTWSVDPRSRWILTLLAASGATSLANVWARVVPRQGALPEGRSTADEQTAVSIPVQVQGQADV